MQELPAGIPRLSPLGPAKCARDSSGSVCYNYSSCLGPLAGEGGGEWPGVLC